MLCMFPCGEYTEHGGWVLNGYEIQLRSQTTKYWPIYEEALKEYLSTTTIHCNSCQENVYQINHFGWQLEGFGYLLSKSCSPKSSVDNQNDYYYMHFLVTSHNGQVATDDEHVMMLLEVSF